ncbi:MAG TPA: DUF5666 domain-containing protein [Thermoanaerobaculia bacterium]|nr:DUF5666 domain-containing protein [Thermoanaerobaculia bacterium]
MKRALFLLLLAIPLFARSRAVSSDPSAGRGGTAAAGATVSGIVSSVNGNLIQLAGGLVTIDATGAKVVVDRGKEGSVAEIQSGMLLFATLKSTDVAANAPLPASMITATRFSATTFFGPVQSVDTASGSFRILGRTVFVNSDTSFGGVKSLSELLPNEVVAVQADVSGGRLVASSVLLVAPIPPVVRTMRGTVKSISADSWVIGELTLAVNAQTKIVGQPKVGDTVEVLYTSENVAISIVKFDIKLPSVTTLHGVVKTITPTLWTLTVNNAETRVIVNERTKILPGIAAGDTVEVLAQKNDDGTLTALAIVKFGR